MLALTNPLKREDVVEQYGIEHGMSQAERDRLLLMTSVTLPWFCDGAPGHYYASQVALTFAVAPPIVIVRSAFVAEMQANNGVLLKIGHFDEVRGVTYVEI